MTNGVPEKSEEQYPLLTVDSGGGDNVVRPQPTVVSVTCTPKQTWVKHWPEFMSACWTTLILLGITFIVFCALSMTAYRQQSCVILKCNVTTPDVFYYHIVHVREGDVVPDIQIDKEFDINVFGLAFFYPCLKFNVIYLIDDSVVNVFRRLGHSKLYNKLQPYNNKGIVAKVEEILKRERQNSNTGLLRNVRTRVEFLSKYMATTPYKQIWRSIPVYYLPFYASAHAVYVHGGIAVDMNAFNEKCTRNAPSSCSIMAILSQHNNDVNIEEYNFLSRGIFNEDSIFPTFHGMVNILTDLLPLFNGNMSFPSLFARRGQSPNTPLVRTHRSKREVSDSDIVINKIQITTATSTVSDFKTEESQNTRIIELDNSTVENTGMLIVEISNETALSQSNNTEKPRYGVIPEKMKVEKINALKQSLIPIIHVYDFMTPWFEFSERLGATKSDPPSESRHGCSGTETKAILAVDPEGSFIAAPRKRHPFLQDIINAGLLRLNPKYAIDRLRKQCSSLFRDEFLCNDFYVFYD